MVSVPTLWIYQAGLRHDFGIEDSEGEFYTHLRLSVSPMKSTKVRLFIEMRAAVELVIYPQTEILQHSIFCRYETLRLPSCDYMRVSLRGLLESDWNELFFNEFAVPAGFIHSCDLNRRGAHDPAARAFVFAVIDFRHGYEGFRVFRGCAQRSQLYCILEVVSLGVAHKDSKYF